MKGLLALAAFAATMVCSSAIAIMGVDFGNEFMKVSVVKPGMPFQVVANFQSKRKTPAMLSFYAGERGFGADAEALLGRKPQLVVIAPQSLLGRNSSHSLAQAYLNERFYTTPTELNERGGLDYILSEPSRDTQRFSAEESSAMLLAHARDYASAVAGQKIVDAVLTVPSFYTQSERLALISAAELAGLKVLSLVDENTAAGIHYGIDRVHGTNGSKPHIMALYNMGSEATQVILRSWSRFFIC
jgi:hypoxia up-regulated 1